MRFEGNKAWQDAIALVSANRDVLYPMAGVLFLIPTLAQAFFFANDQARILASLGDATKMEAAMESGAGGFFAFGLLAGIVQLIGYLALLALLTDRGRPTVGQALITGVRALPTLIGAALLFLAAYVLAGVVIGGLVRTLTAATGSITIAAVLMAGVALGMVYVMVKLSLTLPVVIIERTMNPMTALLRSWRLTAGNSFRLAFFYLLLFVAYLVIAIVLSMVVMGALAVFGGQGDLAVIGGALISGVTGAVASVLFAGLLAAIHRQLAGRSPEADSAAFE